MRIFHAAAAAGLALALLAPAAFAQTPAPATTPPPAPQAIKEVKPGLYMVTGGGGNTTVRVTSGGLVVVDSKNPGQAFYDDLMGQIRTVSQEPVKYLIDTHHHADHSGNNGRFLAGGAKVVAQKNLHHPWRQDRAAHALHACAHRRGHHRLFPGPQGSGHGR
jgi:glyoxylase-like metal-dependent hydrolase (beta-lactamase superfamily II)